MAQFESDRFAGDATLQDILDDPGTGTKKLQAGSPAAAVKAVQRALQSLGWVSGSWTTASGKILYDTGFPDGDYGPWTTATVLAYKTHYGIHFADAAPGEFDGFVGPQTLALLDRQCALLDEGDTAIAARAAELIAAGVQLELGSGGSAMQSRGVRGSAGVLRPITMTALQDWNRSGALFCKRGLGVFLQYGVVDIQWTLTEIDLSTGVARGVLGFPVADVERTPGRDIGRFECGTISGDPATTDAVVEINPNATIVATGVEF